MININNINYSYQENTPVLKQISLEVNKGSLFGLLGPNGAGKSTLISLVAGLYQPRAGSISISGLHYQTERTAILKNLAVVPQDYAFYLQLSVIENIQFFADLYHCNNKQIENAIDLTGLAEHQSKLAKQLSGGLKRRLNLAIGLLNEPELLILDEPTVGIDPQSRQFILKAIKNINARGVTVIYTSHYMEEVEQLCDVVAIMDHGQILKQGKLEQLLSSEQHIEIELSDTDKVNTISNDCTVALNSFGMKRVGQKLSGELAEDKSVKALLELLEHNQLKVTTIRYGKQSLESLFFSLTHSALRD